MRDDTAPLRKEPVSQSRISCDVVHADAGGTQHTAIGAAHAHAVLHFLRRFFFFSVWPKCAAACTRGRRCIKTNEDDDDDNDDDNDEPCSMQMLDRLSLMLS